MVINSYRFYTSLKQVSEKINNQKHISDGYQFTAEFSRYDCQNWKTESSIRVSIYRSQASIPLHYKPELKGNQYPDSKKWVD